MRTKLIVARQPRLQPRVWLTGSCLAAGAAGALAMYWLDPDQGRRRRSLARDQVASGIRHGLGALGRTGRRLAADTFGLAQRARHPQPEEWSVPNDATLAQRVESELFRDPQIPKGRININAEAGVIVLRGEVDRPEQIRAIEGAVSRIPGVRGVHSLLHLPGTPVPDRGSVMPAP
jgi:BON domain